MRRAVLPALAALALAAAAQLDPPMQYLARGRTVDSGRELTFRVLLARRPARTGGRSSGRTATRIDG